MSEETVKLPTFEVTEQGGNPYQAQQALSSSRVALPIRDIPQTVSVVTSEFIQDSMSPRMLDAAKYVTPVVESSLAIGGDRYMIRGFQVSHEFVDGAEISGQDGYSASLMQYNIDRIEVIKGPNAILVPGGSPGGQFNPITKSPLNRDQSSVTFELSQYYTTGISADLNRVLNSDATIASRLVLAYWDSNGYADRQFRRGYMIAPSISFQLGQNNKLVIKGEFMQNRETELNGLPIDLSVGSDDRAFIVRGLPHDFSFGDENDMRHRATERITAELHSNLGEHVTSRLQVIGNHVVREDGAGSDAAIQGTWGSLNPTTGKYEPGVIWTVNETGAIAVPSSTTVALPQPSDIVFTRNNGAVDLFYTEGHLRNDYAIKFDEEAFKSTTVTGFASNFSKVQFKAYNARPRPNVPLNDLDSITFPDWGFVQPGLTNGTNREGRQQDLQLYVYENLALFQDRLLLSGGVSRFWGELTRTDRNPYGSPPAPGPFPSYNLSTTAKSWGVVVKPTEEVSLFYSYNSSGGTMPGSLNPGTYGPTFRAASGDQREFGVKASLMENRLTASIARFDISQQNYPVPNSEYYTLVSQGRQAEADLLPNPLYLNLNSKGWEIEGTYSLNQNLTILANYTSFEMRQPVTDVRVRSVPDENGAVYVDYRFTDGSLAGFGVNLGVDFKGDVAGDLASGYTTTKPLPGGVFVPKQPTFLVGDRTLINLGFTYRRDNWIARVQINNLADTEYIQAALNRSRVVPGDPRNIKTSFTYRF